MDRRSILHWLEEHPTTVHGIPSEIVSRCEVEVRRHAAEDAWLAAKAYVEGRMHEWEQSWGFHATESEVAREVCPLLARELKRHEPHIASGREEVLVGDEVLARLEPEARERVLEWVGELGREVEHRIWTEIVRFTRKEGRVLANDPSLSHDSSWDGTENYAHKAAHVAQVLLKEYDARSRFESH